MRLLLVENDNATRDFLTETFANYDVTCAKDGQEALQHIRHYSFDLMLTDINIPVIDGIELLNRARSYDPDMIVILLTQQASVNSAVAALRHGAFDYLLKPVRRRDIAAAVESGMEMRRRHLRRKQLEQFAVQMLNQMPDAPQRTLLEEDTHIQVHGDLQINNGAFEACMNGEPLNLTPTEFRLLQTLCSAPGVAFKYGKLVEAACGYACSRKEAREIIGTHVRNLRQKLNVNCDEPYYIASVRGVGYLIRVPRDEREEICCG